MSTYSNGAAGSDGLMSVASAPRALGQIPVNADASQRPNKEDAPQNVQDAIARADEVALEGVNINEVPVNNGLDGLTLDVTSPGLQILEVGDGDVHDYNASVSFDKQVLVGDLIVGVDGETNP